MADVDHRLMTPPTLRIQSHRDLDGSRACVWDLRVGQPNVSQLAMPTVHSIEHFLGTYLREASDRVLAVAPMGCQTGFYIVTVGITEFAEMAGLLEAALERVGRATAVPVANSEQCGWAENHSLVGAREVAAWLLHRRDEWHLGPAESDRFVGAAARV